MAVAPKSHWTREPWPWILMAIPASSVVAGMTMLTFAITSNNALVVDDYYKEGKAINQRIGRDREATRLGIGAHLAWQANGIALTLQSAPGSSQAHRDTIGIRLVHVTDDKLDRAYVLRRDAGGVYRNTDAVMPAGRYRIHIETPDRDWRLVSDLFDTGKVTATDIAAAEPAEQGAAEKP